VHEPRDHQPIDHQPSDHQPGDVVPGAGAPRDGRPEAAQTRRALHLSAAHIAELVAEMAPSLARMVAREVHAAPPADLVFVLVDALDDPASRRVFLRVSANPDGARVCVDRSRVARHDGPLGPFLRRCQEDLTGARLERLAQAGGDRVVVLEFRRPDGERRTLVAELVGRHANLVLLGGGDKVLQVLAPPAAEKPDTRLAPGSPWTPPPGRPPAGPAPGIEDSFPAPVEQPRLAPMEQVDPYPKSWRVDRALAAQAEAAHLHRARKDLAERLERRAKNARNLVAGLEQRAAAAQGHERALFDAELVKLSLASIQRGAKEIVVEDHWTDGAPRGIALDPKLSPKENMERLFDKAKKLQRARETVAEELLLARAKEALVLEWLARARDESRDPGELEREAMAAGALEKKQETPGKSGPPPPRLPYRSFAASSGAEIRVGRNAKDNDALTFKHARGNDLWLHTADTPGSHVVLVLAGRPEPHPEDLLDAAHLAVHHSPVAGAAKARVHVARRKEVHKPRGAKPGLVTLSGGKVLELRLQPERLQRLLGSHRPPAIG
jgi:predicted ribosome quality control (RQC) complex YloA/Tae2 family protein